MGLDWRDLHPGVAEYCRWKNGEPLFYQGRREQMPAEWSVVFDFCLRTEKAAKKGDSEIEKLLQMQMLRFELTEQ